MNKRFGTVWLSIFVLLSLLVCPVSAAGMSDSEETAIPSSGAVVYPSYNIIYAYTDADYSSSDILAKQFKSYVEKASGGDIAVQLFSQGILGGSAELASGVRDGVVQIISGDMVEVHNEAYSVFEIPYLFDSIETAGEALDHEGELWNAIQSASEKKHVKLLMAVPLGYRLLSANRRIETIEDLQGLKMRVMVGDIPQTFWTLLGANPVPMDINNLCTALQIGTVEAQENPAYIFYTLNLYKQQKFVIETNHKIFYFSLLMNLDYFNDLPADYQQIILDAGDAVSASARREFLKNEEESREILTGFGIEFISPSEEMLEQMRHTAEQTWDLVRGKAGDELVEIALRAAGKITEETEMPLEKR